jgi:Tol biopolymer transport system component
MTRDEGTMPDTELDRRLTDWLDESAAPRAPKSLETAFVEGVASTRQRPAWATTERWISMETRARLGMVPRTVIILATIAILTALAAGAIVAGSSNVKVAPPFGPASNGSIAYAAGGEIWLYSPDGELTQLTSGDGFSRSPAWSLDGTRIAYPVLQGETYDIVVTHADGTEPLTIASGLATNPGFLRWRPDGSALAFAQVDDSLATDACTEPLSGICGSRVWVAATDGSGAGQVGLADLDAAAPAWSPDGSTIAFAGRVTDQPVEAVGMYLMGADGSDVRRLGDVTGPPGNALYWLDWSPDGTRIATQTTPNVVYSVDVETGEATEVTSGAHADIPIWSPDGTKLVVSALAVGGVVVDEDGTEQPIDALPAGYMTWSPDGTMLIGVTEFQPEAIEVFDLEGRLLETIETPARGTGPATFQRLAP